MNIIPAVTSLVPSVLLTSLPALAHHSDVMFDNYHPRVTITGLVQLFEGHCLYQPQAATRCRARRGPNHACQNKR